MKKINLFELRVLDFIYCCNYIPEIDDKLSGDEFAKEKLFWASPFDIIIFPIGLYFLYKRMKNKNARQKPLP